MYDGVSLAHSSQEQRVHQRASHGTARVLQHNRTSPSHVPVQVCKRECHCSVPLRLDAPIMSCILAKITLSVITTTARMLKKFLLDALAIVALLYLISWMVQECAKVNLGLPSCRDSWPFHPNSRNYTTPRQILTLECFSTTEPHNPLCLCM